jgi:hypothetical protein
MAKLIRADVTHKALWEILSAYLETALETSGAKLDWGTEDVRMAAMKSEVDVWALFGEDERIFGGCVTSLNVYPKSKAVDVLLLGTDPHREDGWMECLEQLKALARGVGARKITGTGRPGWARKLGATERRVFELEV